MKTTLYGTVLVAMLLVCGCANESGLMKVGTWRTGPDDVIVALKKGFVAVPEANEILNKVFEDWFTSPEQRQFALFYVHYEDDTNDVGTVKGISAVRYDGDFFPKNFRPRISTNPLFPQKWVRGPADDLMEGEIGLRLDKFQPQDGGSVLIEFVNAGCCIIGGAFVTYHAEKTNGLWQVTYEGAFDP